MKKNKIGIQGICYDEKSSYLRGPALAPPLIREALYSESANSFTENGKEITSDLFHDYGDYQIPLYFNIERITSENLASSDKLITLGGDHSISYPVIKAYHRARGEFDIVHIDAHADLYDEYEGDPYSHACPFARIMENKHATRLIQIGIRTLTNHQREQADKYGVEIIEMKDFSISTLPILSKPIYLSIDIDALDPAFAPGISHYEPGGLTTRQLLNIIHHIKVPIIGADIVEYNPTRDINQMTAMVAARILKEILGKMDD